MYHVYVVVVTDTCSCGRSHQTPERPFPRLWHDQRYNSSTSTTVVVKHHDSTYYHTTDCCCTGLVVLKLKCAPSRGGQTCSCTGTQTDNTFYIEWFRYQFRSNAHETSCRRQSRFPLGEAGGSAFKAASSMQIICSKKRGRGPESTECPWQSYT